MADEEIMEIEKRRNTSFKITNILPSRPASNDPEESDDPDDSHTEDISGSDLENLHHSLASAASATFVARGRFNIWPAAANETSAASAASSASPASAASHATSNANNHVEKVTSTRIMATAGVMASFPNSNRHKVAYPPHGPTDRFKVVKIMTSKPLRRGRWSVIDYPDKEKIVIPPKDAGQSTHLTAPPMLASQLHAGQAHQQANQGQCKGPSQGQTQSHQTAQPQKSVQGQAQPQQAVQTQQPQAQVQSQQVVQGQPQPQQAVQGQNQPHQLVQGQVPPKQQVVQGSVQSQQQAVQGQAQAQQQVVQGQVQPQQQVVQGQVQSQQQVVQGQVQPQQQAVQGQPQQIVQGQLQQPQQVVQGQIQQQTVQGLVQQQTVQGQVQQQSVQGQVQQQTVQGQVQQQPQQVVQQPQQILAGHLQQQQACQQQIPASQAGLQVAQKVHSTVQGHPQQHMGHPTAQNQSQQHQMGQPAPHQVAVQMNHPQMNHPQQHVAQGTIHMSQQGSLQQQCQQQVGQPSSKQMGQQPVAFTIGNEALTMTPTSMPVEQSDPTQQVWAQQLKPTQESKPVGLNSVQTVPANLHTLGAQAQQQPPLTSADISMVATSHHTYHGPQASHQPLPQQTPSQHMIAPSGSATPAAQSHVTSGTPAAASQASSQFVRPIDLPKYQPQFIPSGPGSTVNSVPPSRDPKTLGGVAASQVGTPTLSNVATPLPVVTQVGVASQTYLESATRDSHPIASEELVERLEEISTRQGSPDASEDPESAEVDQITSMAAGSNLSYHGSKRSSAAEITANFRSSGAVLRRSSSINSAQHQLPTAPPAPSVPGSPILGGPNKEQRFLIASFCRLDECELTSFPEIF